MNTRHLSWQDIEDISKDIAAKVINSDFEPDYLIGITTGGLIPLALISKELKNNNILTVTASSYEKDTQGKLTIKYLPEINLSNKKILLVDEISETGSTLATISKALREKCNIGEIKTCTLAVNSEKSLIKPNYYGIEDSAWIVFPWEKTDFPEYFK